MRKTSLTRLFSLITAFTILALVGPALPADAATLTSNAAATNNQLTSGTNAAYNWSFTTATTATLGALTMSLPATTTCSTRGLLLNSVAGNYASTPDTAANSITGDIDLRVKLSRPVWNSGVKGALLAKYPGAGKAFNFRISTSARLELFWTPDGTSGSELHLTSSTAVPFTDGDAGWVRTTLEPNTGGIYTGKFYTSTDGSSWTQLGSTFTGSPSSIFDGSGTLQVGTRQDTADPLTGTIYYAEMRNGVNGTVVNSFDPSLAAVGGTSWTASTGEVWTVTRTGTYLPADIGCSLTPSSVTGVPSGGAGALRLIDQTASYVFTGTSVPASTAATVTLSGITNTSTAGSYSSTIRTFSTVPAEVDNGSASGLTFFTMPPHPTSTGSLQVAPPTPAATSSVYTFNATGITTSSVKCMKVTLRSTNDGSSGPPTGLSNASVTLGASSTWLNTANSWTVSNSTLSATTTLTSATGTTPASTASLVLNGFVNPTAAGSYYAIVSTYGNTDCIASPLDTLAAAWEVNGDLALQVSIPPSLTVTVSGYNAGTCNGASITATSSTATAVPLGTLSTGATSVGGQTIQVVGNASSGYIMYLRSTGPLTSGGGKTIADWTGSNATPTTFASPGTEAFGYTTDHALSAGSTRFQTNKWAAVTGSNAEVSAIATSGFDETTHVCYAANRATATFAGTYNTTMIYTVVPSF